jgi:hypothetical protein
LTCILCQEDALTTDSIVFLAVLGLIELMGRPPAWRLSAESAHHGGPGS